MFVGYLAERRLVEMWFANRPVRMFDDHDRTHKDDRWLTYKRREFSIEVKSLQSTYTKETAAGWTGRFQVDASDCRGVQLPNGDQVETTCLVVIDVRFLPARLVLIIGKGLSQFSCRLYVLARFPQIVAALT